MSFTSRNGTHGARQPRATATTRWFNLRVIERLSHKGGRFMGMDAIVLETIGKKTGVQRLTPVASFPADGEGWVIVAAASGAARNPSWYYNIAADPDAVSVRLAGKSIPVDPVELHGDERVAAWSRVVAKSPRFTQYERTTDRELPVIRLTPKHVGR